MGGSDGQGIIEASEGTMSSKLPSERGSLHLRIAHRKTICIGGHQAQHVIFNRHLHAGENLTVLIGRGDAPNTRYHFGQNVGRKFDRTLKSKCGELWEMTASSVFNLKELLAQVMKPVDLLQQS